MQKFIVALIAVMVVAGGEAFALPLPSVTFAAGPGNTGGGEFYATTSTGETYRTFCLEHQENLYYGAAFYYGISQAAQGNHAPDSISRATAWLYLQCVSGTLASYGAQFAYDQSVSDANDIQKAFWFLEEEYGGEDNYYVQLAKAEGGVGDNNGYYNVGVMNVWTYSNGTGAAQDQLVLLPPVPKTSETVTVPDGGATIALLGLSLTATACFSRRLKADALAGSAPIQ